MSKRIRFKNFNVERIMYVTHERNWPKGRVMSKWHSRRYPRQATPETVL